MPPAAPSTYSDVIPLWQKCLQQNGLVITCVDEKAASRIRMRLNGYRSSLRHQQSMRMSGLDPQIQHDQFEITLSSSSVIIRPRIVLNDITLEDLDGNAVTLDQDNQPDLL